MHTRLQTGLYSSEQASLIPGILEEFLYLYFISYFTHVSWQIMDNNNSTRFTIKIEKLLVPKKNNWNRKLGKFTQSNFKVNQAEWN